MRNPRFRSWHRRWWCVLLAIGVLGLAGCDPINWPQFMFGPERASSNPAAKAISSANAAHLVRKWQVSADPPTQSGQPAARFDATPVTYNRVIYVGAETGDFYAVQAGTGTVVWKQFLGFVGEPCGAGVASSAAVSPDPATGELRVYVGGGDGFVYALNAADGAVRWKRRVAKQQHNQDPSFLWSSPAVANGRVYIGVAALCDNFPHVPGAAVVALDQVSGAPRAKYLTEPPGATGAGVWSSVSVDPVDGSVFVTTGNADQNPDPGDGSSILRLDGQTLAKLDKWQVPVAEQSPDADFGASPTLFSAPGPGGPQALVGACNKNGTFYAFRRAALAAGPVWRFQVGQPAVDPPACIAGAAFDGTRLYVGGNATTVGGTTYAGSLRALDPANGGPVWQVGLPANVLGTPTVNGSGVVAASTLEFFSAANATRLFDAGTGAILNTLPTQHVFAQPVWAEQSLIVATWDQGLVSYGL
jgi:outer membrane protein assembly factor BamB